ncbi:MAG: dihydropteroate synthase, partial [Actinomycetota bacterium]
REALKAGAAMINDITALSGDRKMPAVVAGAGCPVCLMHMQGEPRTMQENPRYQDVLRELVEFFYDRTERAMGEGIESRNIIIDPGIGFGKSLEHNLAIIRNLGSFLSLGFPVMIGASRKRFLGEILKAETEERLPGTVAVSVLACQKGAQIFRVHDVRENYEALKVAEAVEQRQ